MNKKKILLFAMVLILLASIAPVSLAGLPESCEVQEYGLFKGSKQDEIGTVSVWNDDEYLYVEIETEEPWEMGETHLDILDIIPTERGAHGNYNSNEYLDSDTKTDNFALYKVPLNQDWETIYIRVLVNVNGEGAMGGDSMDPNAWWNLITYEVCQDEGTEPGDEGTEPGDDEGTEPGDTEEEIVTEPEEEGTEPADDEQELTIVPEEEGTEPDDTLPKTSADYRLLGLASLLMASGLLLGRKAKTLTS